MTGPFSVHAQVQGRRRVRQSPHGDAFDSQTGDFARALKRDAAGNLNLGAGGWGMETGVTPNVSDNLSEFWNWHIVEHNNV